MIRWSLSTANFIWDNKPGNPWDLNIDNDFTKDTLKVQPNIYGSFYALIKLKFQQPHIHQNFENLVLEIPVPWAKKGV